MKKQVMKKKRRVRSDAWKKVTANLAPERLHAAITEILPGKRAFARRIEQKAIEDQIRARDIVITNRPARSSPCPAGPRKG